jgi:hypothetical protein
MMLNNMEDNIIWEKWVDPFDFEESDMNMGEDDYLNENSFDETIYKHKYKNIKCQIITTPFGIIPINEHTASGKIFNFWTGHTNFAVTKKIADIIENTSGVETLNVFTKYRFRIAVGKAFKDSEIMRKINRNVYAHLRDTNVEQFNKQR